MKNSKKNILQGIAILIVLGLGVLGFKLLGTKQVSAKRQKFSPPLPVVDTKKITITPSILHITGQGTVGPVQVARIIPQISGKIVFISKNLIKGGRVSRGETLLKIETADYEIALSAARASLKQAQSNLMQSRESSKQAFFEWQLAHSADNESSPPPLAIKLPQLEAAQAASKAAQAEVNRALLNLKRTVIKAPFDGLIQEKNVDLGQYVSPTQNLAVLYGDRAVEVRVPLLLQEAQQLKIPGFNIPADSAGSRAVVREDALKAQWTGSIVRSAGQVDEKTRMLDVYVRIYDPYQKTPPLAIGLFVEVDLQGPLLTKSCRIPASAMRKDNTVWIVDTANKLHIRKVIVAKRLPDEVVLARGLDNGERIITSPLAEVRDGMEVKIEQ